MAKQKYQLLAVDKQTMKLLLLIATLIAHSTPAPIPSGGFGYRVGAQIADQTLQGLVFKRDAGINLWSSPQNLPAGFSLITPIPSMMAVNTGVNQQGMLTPAGTSPLSGSPSSSATVPLTGGASSALATAPVAPNAARTAETTVSLPTQDVSVLQSLTAVKATEVAYAPMMDIPKTPTPTVVPAAVVPPAAATQTNPAASSAVPIGTAAAVAVPPTAARTGEARAVEPSTGVKTVLADNDLAKVAETPAVTTPDLAVSESVSATPVADAKALETTSATNPEANSHPMSGVEPSAVVTTSTVVDNNDLTKVAETVTAVTTPDLAESVAPTTPVATPVAADATASETTSATITEGNSDKVATVSVLPTTTTAQGSKTEIRIKFLLPMAVPSEADNGNADKSVPVELSAQNAENSPKAETITPPVTTVDPTTAAPTAAPTTTDPTTTASTTTAPATTPTTVETTTVAANDEKIGQTVLAPVATTGDAKNFKIILRILTPSKVSETSSAA